MKYIGFLCMIALIPLCFSNSETTESITGKCDINLDSMRTDWNSGNLDNRMKYWNALVKKHYCASSIPLKIMKEIIGKPDYRDKYYKMEALNSNGQYSGCFIQLIELNDSTYYFVGDCH